VPSGARLICVDSRSSAVEGPRTNRQWVAFCPWAVHKQSTTERQSILMMKGSVVDSQTAHRPRRGRLGMAARIGVFAAAGIALLSVAASSASATPLRSRYVQTHHVALTRYVLSRHTLHTRYVSRRRHSAHTRYLARGFGLRPVVTSSGVGGVWACIRAHESGGNYATNTGNGYYGAYQFTLSTWYSVGGRGLPSQASPAEQDMRAQMLQARSGWTPWPMTSRRCGA